jgi:hypothetical protein
MIDLKYMNHAEEADLAGRSVAEVREIYREEGVFPAKAVASLNGRQLARAAEEATILGEGDSLVFAVAKSRRLLYMAGALILALAATGGVFAYGFTSATATFTASVAEADFASVSANTSSVPSWSSGGMQRGSTGTGTLFDIDTASSGYTGDMVASVYLANVDKLAKIYHVLTLSLEVRDSANNIVDINADGVTDSNDFAMLSLNNGIVQLNITQTTPDVYTIKLRGGYYNCNVQGSAWNPGYGSPELYCEINQR